MALVSYYRQPTGSTSIDLKMSPYANAHHFNMEVTGLPTKKDQLPHMYRPSVNSINGFLEEIPEIKYSTTWGDSPVAVINEKIKKFTQNKWIKMFAMQNGDYKPPLLTDGWTQQFPKAAEPLSISFKFRAYPIDMYNTTKFKDIIDLLIFVTTPKDFQLTDTMNYMKDAGKQAETKGEELGKLVNQLKDTIGKSEINFGQIASYWEAKQNKADLNKLQIDADEQNVIKTLNQIGEFIEDIGNMTRYDVGGCPLIKLNINDFIYPSDKIKWILKSWSFKPAINVTDNNNPIYIDFNISLQTQYVLTAADLETLLTSPENRVKKLS